MCKTCVRMLSMVDFLHNRVVCASCCHKASINSTTKSSPHYSLYRREAQRLTLGVTLACLHRACYGVLRFVMESGAKGCEVIVSGKLRAARAKSMKFKDGYMVSSGEPARYYLDRAVRHVLLRQGVLGIKVRQQAVA